MSSEMSEDVRRRDGVINRTSEVKKKEAQGRD